MDAKLRPGERVDDLQCGGLKIIQNSRFFSFGIDAVLLANFAHVRTEDIVVDLGTGSGVIPLLLACKTKASKIYGIEINSDMVDMAKRSVKMNSLDDRIDIIEGDLKEISCYLDKNSVDVAVSNPPYRKMHSGYISPSNARAIATYEIKCTLEDIAESAAFVLKNKGRFYMCQRSARLADSICAMRANGIEPKRLRMVQPFVNKKPNIFLIEGVKGAKPFIEVMPTLVIYDEDGNYTDEIYRIYGMEADKHGR